MGGGGSRGGGWLVAMFGVGVMWGMMGDVNQEFIKVLYNIKNN